MNRHRIMSDEALTGNTREMKDSGDENLPWRRRGANPCRRRVGVMIIAASLVGTVVLLSGARRVLADDARYWTTTDGRRSDVRLSVVLVAGDRVKLRREDNGRIIELPLARLGPADRKYLREHPPTSEQPSPVDFQADAEGFARVVSPFLTRHCQRCHGSQKQEGDFRVDQHLPNDFRSRTAVEKWSEVLNMLNSGAMPPEGEPRPNPAEVAKVAEWIEHERARADRAGHDQRVVLRRMNRQEYNNTIRDLIGIELELVEDFPEDPPAGGFDNNGGALSISPLHLELYLKSAQKILDQAIVDEAQGPGTIRWHFEMEDGMPDSDRRRVRLDDDLNRSVHINSGSRPPRDGMMVMRWRGEECWVQYFRVPRPGQYLVRVRAAGATPAEAFVREEGPKVDLRRHHESWQKNNYDAAKKQELQEGYDKWSGPWVKEHYVTDRTYRYGPPRMRIVGFLGSRRPVLDAYDVTAPVSQPEVYSTKVLLTPEKSSLQFSNAYHIPFAPHFNPHYVIQRDDFPRPELFLDWVEIEGPIYDAWPPTSHRRILIDSPHKGRDETAYAREVLASFMRRAYRRPLRAGEVEPKVALFRQVRPEKPSFEEAIKVPLLTVLASPHFLYLVETGTESRAVSTEGTPPTSPPLNDYELASRLSYFLWSSMPDEELFELAKAGKLSDSATLRAQVDRMLADPKSEALVKNFTGQWLELRKIGFNPPEAYRYDEHLETSMRAETEAFFTHILRNDRSVLEFLSSDYVMINERLARFYDIPGVNGDHFRQVKLPPDKHRGGLVAQASILSITSNGTRTSPVWRGVWILNNLLGDPPPPPPPNAGDIPPVDKDSEKMTLRQRLQLHRQQAQCARCHNKIDPLGFALENFDHAGQWRERDGSSRSSPAIDARAQLPGGTEFDGVDGLRQQLLNRQDQFLKCLAGKLYTYALGRELSYADDSVVDEAVAHMKSHDLTLRSLLHHIATSQVFRRK